MVSLRRPPEEHLTLRSLQQLHSEQATLQTLAVDSIYSFKDEFDLGLNPLRWSTAASVEGEDPFSFDDTANQGGLLGTTGGEDDADIRLFSRLAAWSPGKRCGVQARFTLPSLTTVKLEFGFVSSFFSLNDPNDSDGAVLVKTTPTANMAVFQIACFDTDDDTNLSVIAASQNNAVSSGDPNNESAFAQGTSTVLVWANEQGGVSIWLNGRSHANTFSQPSADASGRAGTTGPPLGSPFRPGAGSHIWFYLQNRAASAGRSVSIDYIQAWQERS